ncbi:family 16 glycosylhydrolase [Flavobacterium fluviatile]|uniref:family 16 glycosylhydrolase n=1 Tax=Flavobacterium fluviatile TaxID=1862387 RepID=UPI0013D85072|nr:family 16 glycosylhydrolase [Flavobacterium fluviatile]
MNLYKNKNFFLLTFSICSWSLILNGQTKLDRKVIPFSDPTNKGNWVLNTAVSDEFDEAKLDENRWYVVGKFENGKPVYKHPDYPNKKVWIGRAPSQFSGNNYRLEDGKLILETKWEPNFPFSEELGKPWGKDETKNKFENITTACLIGRKFFKYGYMEIKSKAADAEITSAFWAMGTGVELDIFEHFGDHRQKTKLDLDRELWWSIHDWTLKKANNSVYTEHHDLGFRVADEFHIYGMEWDENGIKYFVDGKLFSEASKVKINKWAKSKGFDEGYVVTKPLSIWLDQETFPWHGVPDSKEDLELNSPSGKKDDGIVDFEIEYVRVWQKK